MSLHAELLEARLVPSFPLAINDSFRVSGLNPSRVDVLANDLAGGATQIVNVTQPNAGQGEVTANPDGSLTFVPGAAFDTATFRYTVSPRQGEIPLSPADLQADDAFGRPVLSADGNTLFVGADLANVGGSPDAGRVFVYTRSNSGWDLRQNLTASDASSQARFGFATATSADGSVLVVGAPGTNNASGRVYLFRRDANGSYTQTQILNDENAGNNANFGGSIALSRDGTVLAIGATGATMAGMTNAGKAVLYRLDGQVFVPSQILSAPTNTTGDAFGNLAISGDGNTLAVGALGTDVAGRSNAGRVYLFGRAGANYNPIGTLQADTPNAEELFGNSAIAINNDGSVIAVGTLLGDPGVVTNAGQVYLFQRTDIYRQFQIVTAPTPMVNDSFGASVALSDDGQILLVGAPLANSNAMIDSGAAYRFIRGENYQIAETVTGASETGGSFGFRVALDARGTTFTVGVPQANTAALNAGRVVVYERGQSSADVTLTRFDPPRAQYLAATGAPDGSARIYSFDPNGNAIFQNSFTPFDRYIGPVQAATGDVDGDGTFDVVYGIGPGGGSILRIVNGVTGEDRVPAAFTFEVTFAGGIFLAVGDIDGDGRSEIVVSPNVGGGGRIQIFSVINGELVQRDNFFGIEDLDFRGGARVALGDVDGDGLMDLIVGAGFGGGPRIAIFDGRGLLRGEQTPPKLRGDFFAFPGTDAVDLRDGVFVASADLDGDSQADLIFGGGPGGGPRVFILRGGDVLTDINAAQNAPLANFFVGGDTTSRGGIRVIAKDTDADGRLQLVVGSGEGLFSQVRTYDDSFPEPGVEPGLKESFDPFGGNLAAGVYVG